MIEMAPACTWQNEEPRKRLTLTVWTGRDYLVDVYRSRLLPIFRPTRIAALPAVEQQTPEGPSLCTTTVGVAQGQALDASSSVGIDAGTGRPLLDPCAENRRAIEAVVSTLPPL